MKRATIMILLAAAVLVLVSLIRAADPAELAPPAADPPPPPPPIVRFYDVRELLDADADFPLYNSLVAGPFGEGIADNQYSPVANGGSGAAPELNYGPTLEDRIDDMTKRIESAIAPDSWKDTGGATGSLRVSRGSLIVEQTAANHKLLREFLDQWSEQASEMVRVEADWIWVPSADVEKLMKPPGADPARMATKEIDMAALHALPPGLRHIHAEVMGRNGQTVHVVTGREQSMVSNVTPVVSTGTSAFAPTIATVAAGAGLQARVFANVARGTALVTVFTTFDELGSPKRASSAAVAGVVLDYPTTEPIATTRPVAPATAVNIPVSRPINTLHVANGQATSEFNTIGMTLQSSRMTVRLPLGKPVLVSAGTWDPTSAKPGNQLELLVILTVTVSEK